MTKVLHPADKNPGGCVVFGAGTWYNIYTRNENACNNQQGEPTMGFLKKFTKQEISWMMYDWANSAHSVIVVTILPIFFDSVASCTADSVSSMSTWGYATSIAMAIVALAAPFLGVFGDIRGMRKKLFTAGRCLGGGPGLYAADGLCLLHRCRQ